MKKTQQIDWKPFSKKHKDYIRRALSNKMNVAEGAIRSGKTIDHCIIAAMYLEVCPDKIHLATGATIGHKPGRRSLSLPARAKLTAISVFWVTLTDCGLRPKLTSIMIVTIPGLPS